MVVVDILINLMIEFDKIFEVIIRMVIVLVFNFFFFFGSFDNVLIIIVCGKV